jgi:hypothetical protein
MELASKLGQMVRKRMEERLKGRKAVYARVEQVSRRGDYTDMQGVRATCSKCGHQVECFGTGERSRNRVMAMLRESCPERQDNYYSANPYAQTPEPDED